MTDLLVTCRDCQGYGLICSPIRAVGVCWATPHGIPDWDEWPCRLCEETGQVPYWEYYETAEEALSSEPNPSPNQKVMV